MLFKKGKWWVITIETKKLVISEELKREVEMICKFAYVEYSFTNGYIINLKNTNITYVKPHILKVKGNDYLIFEDSEYVWRWIWNTTKTKSWT